MYNCIVCGFLLNEPSKNLLYYKKENKKHYYCNECNQKDKVNVDYLISNNNEVNGITYIDNFKINLYINSIYHEVCDSKNNFIDDLISNIHYTFLHEYLHFIMQKNCMDEYKNILLLKSGHIMEEERMVSILTYLLLEENTKNDIDEFTFEAIQYGEDYLNYLRFVEYNYNLNNITNT